MAWVFYIYTLCERAANALVSLCIYTGSSESSLLANLTRLWKTEFGKINDYSREKYCTNPYFSFSTGFVKSADVLWGYEDT